MNKKNPKELTLLELTLWELTLKYDQLAAGWCPYGTCHKQVQVALPSEGFKYDQLDGGTRLRGVSRGLVYWN